MTYEQTLSLIDGFLLTIAAIALGSLIGWAWRHRPTLRCGNRAYPLDFVGSPGDMACELRPFHRGSHRNGRHRWAQFRTPDPSTFPCRHGHAHATVAGRDDCEVSVRRMLLTGVRDA